ncbi:zinc-dependent alcohol dehydrogenase [Hydrogenophaga sp. BPS33]|uniref:zinc-dependent alcohol dehydrogenase n=1 Tax=Hydrogenophaga sp. BPS33 TaxID=2651974 RepID=UPI00131F9753|nr:alcohol dehydrogenase catalytic domain-containing protein [Hydrogenophaga sp. BPS33]QHE87790.1 alcohol dehydrogenase catalytic domain-containing protein [Hydrogenophaga sp. BPS33]
MKTLRKVRPDRGLELQDAPTPMPGPGEVLVQVQATGVCGTDLHIDKWTPSYHFMGSALPVTIGHEFAGVVAALGQDVHGLAVGQRVTVRPSVVCGVCAACTEGRADDCVTRKGIGVSRDGAFADFVRVPVRNCVPVPQGLEPKIAALAEPLSVSWEAVRAAGVTAGDKVLVLGPGNIGQGIALFARAAGAAEVVVAGHGDAPRLQILRQLGFDQLLDFAEQPMAEALAKVASSRPFDVVIEATGVAAVIGPAMQALKPRGVLVITGIHAAPVAIDLTALVRKHQEIRGSYRAPEAAWPQVVAFMEEHQSLLAHMVTHTVPLSRALEGFELARNKTATKVMVVPDVIEEASA